MAPSRDVARVDPDAPQPHVPATPGTVPVEVAVSGHAALSEIPPPTIVDVTHVDSVTRPLSNAEAIEAAQARFIISRYDAGSRIVTSFSQHPLRWSLGLILVVDLLLIPILLAIAGLQWAVGAGLFANAAAGAAVKIIRGKKNDNPPNRKADHGV